MENQNKNLPIFELILNGQEFEGVYANSLVSDPANQMPLFAFSKEKVKTIMSSDEKRMIAGVFLVPEQLIFRRDLEGNEFYVKFTKETIEQVVKLFAKNNNFNRFNREHSTDLDGVFLTQTWIVGEEDKIYSYGFTKEQVPVGSWVGLAYVENDVVWSDVKEGKYRGFSIEGFFDAELVKWSKTEETTPEQQLEDILLDENKTDEQKERELLALLIKNQKKDGETAK